jgi:hypothetical protein
MKGSNACFLFAVGVVICSLGASSVQGHSPEYESHDLIFVNDYWAQTGLGAPTNNDVNVPSGQLNVTSSTNHRVRVRNNASGADNVHVGYKFQMELTNINGLPGPIEEIDQDASPLIEPGDIHVISASINKVANVSAGSWWASAGAGIEPYLSNRT